MAFADGGYNDGGGIPALASRKVRKIIAVTCVTPDQFFYDKENGSDPAFHAFVKFSSLFGLMEVSPESLVWNNPGLFYIANSFNSHAFDLYSNGENQILKLMKNIRSLQEAGNPLITTLENLTVVENPFWGTVAGETVDLTVIHMVRVLAKFSEQVPQDAAPAPEGRNFTEHGYFTNEELAFVPNLKHIHDAVINVEIPDANISIFNLTLPDLEFALNPKAARMTQILGSWMVKEAWEGLEGSDGEMKFGGFKKLFGSITSSGDTETPVTATAATSSARAVMATGACTVFSMIFGLLVYASF